mgnify:CR=1 FL=1
MHVEAPHRKPRDAQLVLEPGVHGEVRRRRRLVGRAARCVRGRPRVEKGAVAHGGGQAEEGLAFARVDRHLEAQHRQRLGGEAQVAMEATEYARLGEIIDLPHHHLAARKCWAGRPERGPAGAEVARDGREAVETVGAQPCERADSTVRDDELTQLAVAVTTHGLAVAVQRA